jgi:hypothetical protein
VIGELARIEHEQLGDHPARETRFSFIHTARLDWEGREQGEAFLSPLVREQRKAFPTCPLSLARVHHRIDVPDHYDG